MDHSTLVTMPLLRDILIVMAEGDFGNPAELVQSEAFPGGSTKEVLINHVIKELEYATTQTTYTVREALSPKGPVPVGNGQPVAGDDHSWVLRSNQYDAD